MWGTLLPKREPTTLKFANSGISKYSKTMFNRGYQYRHVLGPEAAGQNVLAYLANAFPHSTTDEWRCRLKAGEILVNNRPVDDSQPLRAGQVLLWNRPPWLEEETPQHFNLLYRDAFLLAVDKPSGLPTIPGGGFYQNTLLTLVRRDFPLARPLHRLGRGTSGLVLFALDTETASDMHESWPNVQKQYQALASSVASEDTYDIRFPIGELAHPRLGKVHAACSTGKPARSIARVLRRLADSTLFEVDLLTGRPHQIRIHLAGIGCPLLGDPLYGAGGVPISDRPGLPVDLGYHLHAKRLCFVHPKLGKTIELRSPLPEMLRL